MSFLLLFLPCLLLELAKGTYLQLKHWMCEEKFGFKIIKHCKFWTWNFCVNLISRLQVWTLVPALDPCWCSVCSVFSGGMPPPPFFFSHHWLVLTLQQGTAKVSKVKIYLYICRLYVHTCEARLRCIFTVIALLQLLFAAELNLMWKNESLSLWFFATCVVRGHYRSLVFSAFIKNIAPF